MFQQQPFRHAAAQLVGNRRRQMHGAHRVHTVAHQRDFPINLAGGQVHTINETQRQTSSCPVLFVYNGKKFQFFSDVLGVAGVGYMLAPG